MFYSLLLHFIVKRGYPSFFDHMYVVVSTWCCTIIYVCRIPVDLLSNDVSNQNASLDTREQKNCASQTKTISSLLFVDI